MSENAQPAKDPNVATFSGRLSFPIINEKQRLIEEQRRKKKPLPGEENKTAGFGWAIIMDKVANAADIEKAKSIIERIASEKAEWAGKTVLVKGQKEPLVKQSNLKADKVVLHGIALHDGEDKADKDGYGDHVMFISANRNHSKGPPKVCDKTLQDVRPEESHYPYAGCYVKVSVRFWPQDNDFGKRVNAEARVIIFDKHGEPFGAAPVDAESDFAGVDLDEDVESAPASTKKPAAKADIDIDDM